MKIAIRRALLLFFYIPFGTSVVVLSPGVAFLMWLFDKNETSYRRTWVESLKIFVLEIPRDLWAATK